MSTSTPIDNFSTEICLFVQDEHIPCNIITIIPRNLNPWLSSNLLTEKQHI